MSLVCKTLVYVESSEILKIVAQSVPHPKYELEFVDNIEEATARAFSNHIDMFIVDSRFADDEKVNSIRHHVPTLVVEPEYTQVGGDEPDTFKEATRMKTAAEKLLRKNYINWIIDALEYSS
ncbi:MAG: hypothetical protein M1378_09330 [Bacteroidetes bacterium]|nr:hypothetical protein [Bacteroidota bacterium]